MTCWLGSTNFSKKLRLPEALSNMRLKLTGLSLLMESEWLCPGGHELSFNGIAPCGQVARS
jgi:hypothetical protein